MATVTLDAAHKVYPNGVAAVHGIDLEIGDGEFVVLVGPSGCGKSTLLRMIAGLETVTGGHVAIDGTVVNDREPGERDIAMVFQNYALYPHMSVYDNMAYGLKNRGFPRAEIRRKVQESAGILELTELLERRPGQLSGGQRQRVAMGRAIVRDPRVFLFDEPLSNLDAKLRVQMRLEIKKLQQRLATTSIYVTHDQVEAMTMADRLVVLDGGRVEQIGTPITVYEHPASRFVGEFIGSPPMNFLPVRMDGAAARLRPDGPALKTLDAPPAGPALLGVRPERMRPVACEAADILLTVDVPESLGADTLIHGRIADAAAGCPCGGTASGAGADTDAGAGAAETDVVVRLPGHSEVAAGDVLPVALDRDFVHLFDRASGARIG